MTAGALSPKRRRVKRSAFILLILLAACKGEQAPNPAETNVGPPPPQICAQIAKAIDQIKNQSSIQYDDKGEATIEQEAWLAMTPDNHVDLARTLAFHAACKAGHQSDAQPVRIRNEIGTILLETTVPTKVDLRSITH
ncbi:MAG: hypothetical protein JWP15_3430 [Alphaproteobacteria bacterium]|nr:hypothetical protein [Alphaproteobacteria bacterium]